MLVLTFLVQVAAVATVCVADPNAAALDHAIIAVHDLENAARAFRQAGFRIKPGRLHANGLLNGHMKFPDGTEIELMTVRGNPGDDMARRYMRIIAAGDGGAYVALKTASLDEVQRAAAAGGLGTRRSSSGPWQFLGFADTSSAAAVFFTSGGAPVLDADSIFTHSPRVTELAEVWVEGGTQLTDVLRAAGAVSCGSVRGPAGRTGERWRLARGSVVVVPARGRARPRVLGAVLRTSDTRSDTVRPVPQFWIRYESATLNPTHE